MTMGQALCSGVLSLNPFPPGASAAGEWGWGAGQNKSDKYHGAERWLEIIIVMNN